MLLSSVKSALGITDVDTDVDMTINLKINAVKGYLVQAGATIEDPANETVVSCIAIGVNDLLNNKSGETKFSPAFDMLAKQICRG